MLLKGLTRPMIATLLEIGHPEARDAYESRDSPMISDHRVQGSIRAALERAMKDIDPILVTLSTAQADELLAWQGADRAGGPRAAGDDFQLRLGARAEPRTGMLRHSLFVRWL